MYRRYSSTILFCNVNYIICSVVVNSTSQDLIGLLYLMKFFVIGVTDCRHACGTCNPHYVQEVQLNYFILKCYII